MAKLILKHCYNYHKQTRQSPGRLTGSASLCDILSAIELDFIGNMMDYIIALCHKTEAHCRQRHFLALADITGFSLYVCVLGWQGFI